MNALDALRKKVEEELTVPLPPLPPGFPPEGEEKVLETYMRVTGPTRISREEAACLSIFITSAVATAALRAIDPHPTTVQIQDAIRRMSECAVELVRENPGNAISLSREWVAHSLRRQAREWFKNLLPTSTRNSWR